MGLAYGCVLGFQFAKVRSGLVPSRASVTVVGSSTVAAMLEKAPASFAVTASSALPIASSKASRVRVKGLQRPNSQA
jgi:ABC-type phosphate transport system substrate-binding protein